LNGLTFRHCADCKLSGILVKGVWQKPAAVSLENCDRMTLTDLSILDSDGIGLLMKDCTRCRVSDCLIRDDRPLAGKRANSFQLEGGRENWITSNLFANGIEVTKGAAVLEGNHGASVASAPAAP